VIPGEGVHPLLVLAGPLPQDFLGDGSHAMHVTEEMYDVFWPRQQRQMAQDDDPIKTVIYKCQQLSKELDEIFHRSSSLALA
jgi:hypothetical protein